MNLKKRAVINFAILILVIFGSTFSVCLGATSSGGGTSSDDWAMFRHDLARIGTSTSSSPNTNQTDWIYTTSDSVRASPTVVNGVVYIGSFGGDFYALDASTGGKIWSFITGGAVWSSAAVANGVVYVGSNDGYLYALNANTGTKIWSFLVGGGIFSSPAVSGNLVYIGGTNDNVYALDASTGNMIWNYSTANQVRASPAIVEGVLYIASEDGYVYALDASTGTKIWSSPTASGDSYTCSSPAIFNGVLYVGAHDGKIYAFRTSNGAQIWNYSTGSIVESSPAVVNGMVYVGSDDGKLYALDASTGTLRWSYTTSAPVYASPAVAGGIVYAGSWNGLVYALDATTGARIWSYQTGAGVFSSPAIANGVMYIGSYDDNLYTFGTYVPTSNSSQLSTEVWTPPPLNAAAAIVVAGVATGLVSLAFVATTNPLGGFAGKIGERLWDILPDNLKRWLEDYIASKHKLRIEEKTGSPFRPTNPEILAYAISITFLTISFSYVKASSLADLAAILPVYFATSILVGLVKKFFSITYLRSRGIWTEHKVWLLGLVLFIVTTFVLMVPFSSPTRNVTSPPTKSEKGSQTSDVDSSPVSAEKVKSPTPHKRHEAIVSAAEILITLSFAGFFSLLILAGFGTVGGAGLVMCLLAAFFDTFPIPPMSGKGIYDHSRKLWVVLFATTLVLYVLWLIFL